MNEWIKELKNIILNERQNDGRMQIPCLMFNGLHFFGANTETEFQRPKKQFERRWEEQNC